MPTSIRENALAALKAKLVEIGGGGGAVPGTVVRRNPQTEAAPTIAAPVLELFDGGHSPDNEEDQATTKYTMQALIQGYVQAATDEAAGTAVNALYAAVVAKLTADLTLGVQGVESVFEGEFDMEIYTGAADKPTGEFSLTVAIRFWTRFGDPNTAGA